MSGSEDWNDLDAGGSGHVPKRGARPDLQEKMRRRFRHNNQSRNCSSSENTSPVPFGEGAIGHGGAFRQVPDGAAAASSEKKARRSADSSQRVETPELHLDDPDANGNFMFHDGHNSAFEPERSRTSASGGRGSNLQGQASRKPSDQSHYDKALDSVLCELDRDEKSQRRQKSQGESDAVFQNNFDDLEPSRTLNIPAAGAAGVRLGAYGGNSHAQGVKRNSVLKKEQSRGEEADDEDDDAMEGRPQKPENEDPVQQMLGSMMKGGQNQNDRNDPLAALLGGRPDGIRNNGGLGGLFGGRIGGGDPLEALLGGIPGGNRDQERRQGERNDNEDPFAALLGRGGRNPFGGMMGIRDNAEEQKKRQNAGNDFISSVMADGKKDGGLGALLGMGQNKPGGGDGQKDRKQGVKSEEEYPDGERHDDENDDPMEGNRQADRSEPKEDRVAAMLKDMTKGMKGSANPFAPVGIAGDGAGEQDKGGVGGQIGEAGRNRDPLAVLRNRRSGGVNPHLMGSSMGGVGRDEGGGMMGLGSAGLGGGGSGGGIEAMMGGGGSGMNPLAAMMGGGGGGGGSGMNPLAAMMGGGGGGGGGGSGMNPLAAMMGGGGGGGGSGMNPLAAMMGGGSGGGGNPYSGLMGGMGGNPLAALMGAGGRGRGGGGGDAGIGDLAAMLGGGGGRGGRGDQMSQAINSFMGGAGGGRGGGSPMASAMSAISGGGGGKKDGPQEELLRHMMGQAGVEEEVIDPNKASDNDIVQQLLGYETMRAQSNRSPRAEQAMHTILIVDTSGSMDGEPLIEAGQFISQFVNGLEELQFEYNLQENVALVCVGGEIQVVQHFTNDYSLIRRATDSLTASGSSRLHMGLLLPNALLSQCRHDTRGMGGVYQMGNHIACPRVIFISDGYPTSADDIPGQLPRPDDQMMLTLQNLCLELMQNVTEKTLCKIYSVPVGSANLNFLEMLSQSSGGKLIQPVGAKHMSRGLLHHVLVSKLHERGKQKPTREAVAEILKQITATAEEDDINGVFEVIDEGEPDVQARDQRAAQEAMQAMQGRGRGRGRGGNQGEMQGLDAMAQMMGQGQIPGGLQALAGRGRGGGGIPMMRGRGQQGGESPDSLGGLQAMLGMAGGRRQGGGDGLEAMRGVGGGFGALEGLMGRGGSGGGSGCGFGALEGLMGLGRGGGMGGGSGGSGLGALEGLMGMGRGSGMGGSGGGGLGALDGLMSMGGGGCGSEGGRGGGAGDLESLISMANGSGEGGGGHRGFEALLGMGGASNPFKRGDNAGKARGRGGGRIGAPLGLGGVKGLNSVAKSSRKDLGSTVVGDGKGEVGSSQTVQGGGKQEKCEQEQSGGNRIRQDRNGGLHPLLGMGGGDEQEVKGGIGLGQISGGSHQCVLGMGDREKHGQAGSSIESAKRQTENDRQRLMLGMGVGDKNADGGGYLGQIPSGSLQAMSQMEDRGKSKQAAGRKRRDVKKGSENEGQPVMLGMGDGTNPSSDYGLPAAHRMEARGDETVQRGERSGQIPSGNLNSMLGLGDDGNMDGEKPSVERTRSLAKSPLGEESRETPVVSHANVKSTSKPQPEASAAGCEEPVFGLLEEKSLYTEIGERGRGLFSNVPPCSFGLDAFGNPQAADLMEGVGGNDKEGNELMEKLASLLGNEEPRGGGILGNDADDVNHGDDGSGLLRGLPDMLGLGVGRGGRMGGDPDNQLPNLGGGPPDIKTFIQNLRREARAQNGGVLRDEDGDVVMGGLGAMGESEIGAPFGGLGGAGERNLPFFGGGNRGQQGAPVPQGFGQPPGGAPDHLQQLQQLLQNSQGGNQGMPSLEEMLGQLGMGQQGRKDDSDDEYRGFLGGV